MNYWLMKTEPETYAWDDLVRDGHTGWDGVRNYGARNHVRTMVRDDLVFIYHSGNEKVVKGIAKVVKEAYADDSDEKGDWSQVDIAPVKALKREVTLEEIKKNKTLNEMVLVKNSRLSVQPVKKVEWDEVMKMAME